MRLRRIAAVGWTIMIAVACWTPRKVVEKAGEGTGFLGIPHFDKVVHLGVFAGFAFLWMAALRRPRYAAVAIAGLLFAIVTELGQLIPRVNRDAEVGDGLVDLLGVMIGLVAYRHAALWMARRREAAAAPVATGAEAA